MLLRVTKRLIDAAAAVVDQSLTAVTGGNLKTQGKISDVAYSEHLTAIYYKMESYDWVFDK